MTTLTTIRDAEPSDLDTVARLLARALDEPVTRWLVPDPARRTPTITDLFTVFATDAFKNGHVDVLTDDAGHPLAAALWFDLTTPDSSAPPADPPGYDSAPAAGWRPVDEDDAARWQVLDALMTRHHLQSAPLPVRDRPRLRHPGTRPGQPSADPPPPATRELPRVPGGHQPRQSTSLPPVRLHRPGADPPARRTAPVADVAAQRRPQPPPRRRTGLDLLRAPHRVTGPSDRRAGDETPSVAGLLPRPPPWSATRVRARRRWAPRAVAGVDRVTVIGCGGLGQGLPVASPGGAAVLAPDPPRRGVLRPVVAALAPGPVRRPATGPRRPPPLVDRPVDPGFVRYICRYRSTMRPRIRRLVAEHGRHLDVILTSRRQVDRWLAALPPSS
jgi:hypothetical protein